MVFINYASCISCALWSFMLYYIRIIDFCKLFIWYIRLWLKKGLNLTFVLTKSISEVFTCFSIIHLQSYSIKRLNTFKKRIINTWYIQEYRYTVDLLNQLFQTCISSLINKFTTYVLNIFICVYIVIIM